MYTARNKEFKFKGTSLGHAWPCPRLCALRSLGSVHLISFITNDTLVVLRTPHVNTRGKILDGFETFTIKRSKGSNLPISVNFLITNDTLVVLRTPHVNSHEEMLVSFKTFPIENFKGSDLTISLNFLYH